MVTAKAYSNCFLNFKNRETMRGLVKHSLLDPPPEILIGESGVGPKNWHF